VRTLNLYYKRLSFSRRLRGYFYNAFLLDNWAKKLQISNGVEIFGNINIGSNVYIGSNAKIYKENIISDNVYIGDNVEIRCNAGNKINIGEGYTINRGSLVMGKVTILNDCLIAPLCIIVGSNHNFSKNDSHIKEQGISSKGIIIESNVWLGAQVTVLDGVKIGEGAIIGAGSVVTKDIPPNCIAVGNPCKVIKERK